MFAPRFFAKRFYAGRYWPQPATAAPPTGITTIQTPVKTTIFPKRAPAAEVVKR